MNWKAGEVFWKTNDSSRMYRVRRVKGAVIFYMLNHLGDNPPRGMIRQASRNEAESWIKVKPNYSK